MSQYPCCGFWEGGIHASDCSARNSLPLRCSQCQREASALITGLCLDCWGGAPQIRRSEVLDGAKEAVAQRHEQYSSHGDAFEASAALKAVWRQYNHGKNGAAHDEAIEMILHKIGRIATGEVAFLDSYKDTAGYADRAYEKAVLHKEKGS